MDTRQVDVAMDLIDTHCHLTFEPLAGDVPEVIARSRAAGITGWITVGTSLEDSRKAIELAGTYENMYAAIGIHPHEAKDGDAAALAELKRLAGREKVVAIGETGLDFHYNFSKQPDQARVFVAHLEIAREMELPVVIHSRNAFDETVEILDRSGGGLKGVVFHCFSGSAEQAKQLLGRGYYLSFTGVVTFKNAEATREAAKVVPLDRLMVETDAPYMSPEPMRKQKPNEPALMVYTAQLLADLKGVNLDNLAQTTMRNALEFFGLSEQRRTV
jgi:TatD DNase family protein